MSVIKTNKMMFIIYVESQDKSKVFYRKALGLNPSLDVPGMTEFDLTENTSLGIMPGDGIVRVLDNKVPNPNSIKGIPKCELYLFVDSSDECYERALEAGGVGISKGMQRNWGDYVAYCSDVDSNIIAFARRQVFV